MPKTPPPADFNIHVDGSCLTDSTDLGKLMAPERVTSRETVVHHDSWSAATEEKPSSSELSGENEQAIEDDETSERHNAEDSSEDEGRRDARERQIDRIEAQIQAAARAVVASIEKDHYGGKEESVLSTQTDESYEEGSQMTYDRGTELTYESTELTYDGTEGTYESEHEPHSEHEGDSSSHHDGDIDDDVFSRNSGHSQRSSLNSLHELSSADEVMGKMLTSPSVGEEAIQSSPSPEEPETMSRIPSTSSYTPRDSNPITPSKVLTRPPFRTPSSVRAIQMSSPTPSLFSSPRSSKRNLPTVSRIGTPNSVYHSPTKNRTPRRFKVQKEEPLVLLHATVIPLTWNYSHIISSPDLPLCLAGVRENWRLLQEKLGDTVLERGILLPHPQDSYEILEERLLEALELPVRPRAKILKCGHYLGPETPSSSDDEGKVIYYEAGVKKEGERRWCDICLRDVRLEIPEFGGREGERRFRIKIYASNGLMTAGSWLACWKQMESIDVELEPFVDSSLVAELEHLAAVAGVGDVHPEQEGDGFEDVHPSDEQQHEFESHVVEEEQARAEEESMRAQAEDATMRRKLMEEEDARRAQEVDEMARKIMDEERRREIYGHDTPAPPMGDTHSRPSTRASSRAAHDDDSLPDLMVKAFKVAMRDKKNVAICVLSILVLLLALRTGSSTKYETNHVIRDSDALTEIVMESRREPIYRRVDSEAEMPASAPEPVQVVRKDVPVHVAETVKCYEVPSLEVVKEVEREEQDHETKIDVEKVTIAPVVESPILPSEPAVKQAIPESNAGSFEENIEDPIESPAPLQEIYKEQQGPQVEA